MCGGGLALGVRHAEGCRVQRFQLSPLPPASAQLVALPKAGD